MSQRELKTRQLALHGPEAGQGSSLPPRQLGRVDGAPRCGDLPPRAGADVSGPDQRADLLDEQTVHGREDAEVAADALELGVVDVERRRGQPRPHAHTRSSLKLPREPQVDVGADGYRSRREPRRRTSVRARLDRVDHDGGGAQDPDALDGRAEQALGLCGIRPPQR